ncbi:hypothetical protein [Aestuariibaculum sediminum]|uniref:SPOR domain-containing protein n=1 Tax=Aestuariibaculum sediminum TaxID=2770637 RepID=A0A8J6UF03_9FLAO|nr:hypothetical protein [Aestuariibaculum sediminum]MBD0831166.1 hypothetical protein [Aestuariibaculum sediminum]
MDIDDDKSTFSSSAADLQLSEENQNIVYAALYWSATYTFEYSKKKTTSREIIYKGNGIRKNDINDILFKTPSNVSYIPITGDVIFDSHTQDLFKANSPYVCYADVTDILKTSTKLNGTYTVANIKASQGYISGGSSGGWLLYVIYESENETPKYFTTYNGFIGVENKPENITFNGFKTPENGEIKTSIAMGTLEGDRRIKTDYCNILNPETKLYIPLKHAERAENNFFNSSITIDNSFKSYRTPNSSNTLGFDLLKLDIPNKNNAIIKPNSTETTLQLVTKVDRFYLFFMAFETEISSEFMTLKNQRIAYLPTPNETPLNSLASKNPLDKTFTNSHTSHKIPEPSQLNNKSIIKQPSSIGLNQIANQKYNEIQKVNKKGSNTFDLDMPTKTYICGLSDMNHVPKVQFIKKSPSTTKDSQQFKTRNQSYSKTPIKPLKKASKKDKYNTLFENKARFTTIKIPSLKQGYYLVTNVFSEKENAEKWMTFLKKRGFHPEHFINPNNNWFYVYVIHDTNIRSMLFEKGTLEQRTYFNALWIVKINN